MQEPWPSHDMSRPRPARIEPADSPAQPPAGAVVLFDGTSLDGWIGLDGAPARWSVRDGYFEVARGTGDIQSIHELGDVQLHLEWATPVPAVGTGQERGNSGVFLMGLYEIQVLDSYQNDTYPDGYAGAVYGQHPPIFNATLSAGEWQAYDIVFRRPRFDESGALQTPARFTIFHNGICVQNNVEVRGPTRWMQPMEYNQHPDRLPLRLQDHGDPVRFRNIWAIELPDPGAQLPPARAAAINIQLNEPERYAGRYCRGHGHCQTITNDVGVLWLHFEGAPLRLEPLSAERFRVGSSDAYIVFNQVASGSPSGYTLHIGGAELQFTRQSE